VDGGGEFAAAFEQACQQKELLLFVLPPKSPKLNAHVERSHRTHNESSIRCKPSPTKSRAELPAASLGEKPTTASPTSPSAI
jgi:hypothetical protein